MHLIIGIIVSIMIPIHGTSQQAIISVPIADLLGSPAEIGFSSLGKSINERYQQLPYCGSYNAGIACPRVHQALYNDVVTIISSHLHQVCITISQSFFITNHNARPQNLYWTLKSNIIPLSDIAPSFHKYIPPTLNFKHPVTTVHTDFITLKKPWHNQKWACTFSAGTRFIIDPAQTSDTHYYAHAINPTTKKDEIYEIPKEFCMLHTPKSPHEYIHDFVALLREWAHYPLGHIPYVWGGCSMCDSVENNNFNEIMLNLTPTIQTSFFARQITTPVKTGFDCAGLILRAAQLVGIPYFFKNTLTLSTHLEEIKSDQNVENGDLIWIPGHVMIISDVSKNLLIEARSYSHGYGIIHEIPLSQTFEGIPSYDNLLLAYNNKEPLTRIDKWNKPVEKVKQFKLLKMSSVWRYH